jgi:hypothetical protein
MQNTRCTTYMRDSMYNLYWLVPRWTYPLCHRLSVH